MHSHQHIPAGKLAPPISEASHFTIHFFKPWALLLDLKLDPVHDTVSDMYTFCKVQHLECEIPLRQLP